MTRRGFSWVFTIVCLILGFSLIALDFIPGKNLKSLADGLAADGEFQSLTLGNVGIFKIIFTSLGIILLGLSAISYYQSWAKIRHFLKQVCLDTISFFRPGIDGRKGIISLLSVLLLILVAIVYRLEYLFTSLHHDEAYTFMAFAHSFRAAISDYHLPNNHVFHSILVFISTHVFGNSPWAVRLPAFIAGVLLVPTVYVVGRQHYNRWVGLFAGMLVSISPALVGYSVNARGYTLVALFGILLLILGHVVRKKKNRFVWLLIIVISAFGMYTIPAFLFPMGILYVWLFWENWNGSPPGYPTRLNFLKYWLISGVSASIFTLVLYLPILLYSGPESLFSNPFVSPVPWSDIIETLYARLSETWIEWTFRVPICIVLLMVLGFVLSIVFHKKFSRTRIPIQLAAFIWIITLLVIQRPNAWSKIWVFLLPMVLIWVSAGMLGFLNTATFKKIPVSALIFFLCLISVGIRSINLILELPELWSWRGDEEQVVLLIKDRLQPGDGLVVAPPDDAPVWYYAEVHGLPYALSQAEGTARWLVLVNTEENQTVYSVMQERGPEQEFPLNCDFLDSVGKFNVYMCLEDS